MRTCHYQDRPGRRSICLRRIDAVKADGQHKLRWKFCDDGEECPHRNWDQETRTKVTRARSDHLGSCEVCGHRHDLVEEQMSCHLERRIGSVLKEIGPPEGSREPLLDDWYPRSMRERAWRRVRGAVIDRDARTCRDCGKDLMKYPGWYTEVHHIIAVVDGGSDHPSNLITLCVECHRALTDDKCRQSPSQRPSLEKEGNSHRRSSRVSQSYIDDCLQQ